MRKSWKTGAALVLTAAGCLAFLAGCGENGEKNGAVTEVARAEYPKEKTYKNEEEQFEAERNQAVPEKFGEALTGFSYTTASKLLQEQTKNTVYSPISLYYALALSAEGANGETRKEILNLLDYPYAENLSADCKAAYEFLYRAPKQKQDWGDEPDPHDRYALVIANSLWADQSVELKDNFASHAADYFYSDLFAVDFQAEETPLAMESWVQERTNGLIKPKIALNREAILSIMNTVYFYDEWTNRFDSKKTAEDVFFCADQSEVQCDFMNMKTSSHGFKKGEYYTSSSLKLKNGSMEFFLPAPGVDVHELVKSPESLKEMMEGDEGRSVGEVTWKVPKFSMDSSLKLTELLKELGVEKAFEDADFSNMTDSPAFISNVNQDAHISIDENGVEAAAFTKIMYAGAARPAGSAEMILNRPFLYVIKNRNQILFFGICENPTL